jgi:hypothetical protein
MTDPRIHELLAEPLENPGEALTPEAEHVLRHLAVGASVLASLAPEYLALRARVLTGESVTTEALELAGVVAAVLRSARSHPDALVAAGVAGLSPMALLDALDELLHSLVLLTDPAQAVLGLTAPQLESLLELDEVRRYLSDD